MGRTWHFLIGLVISLILLSGCNQSKEDAQSTTEEPPGRITLPTETIGSNDAQGWQIYSNDELRVALKYPPDWILESESYQSVILVPLVEEDWEPAQPSDISKNPAIRIAFGSYIRERIGPNYFPENIDLKTLQAWIEEKVRHGEANGLRVRQINGFLAIEVTETLLPSCEQVTYWRPDNLENLVRLSTSCNSPYLDEFNNVVNSIQQVND